MSVFQAKREYTCWIDPDNRVSRNEPPLRDAESTLLFAGLPATGAGCRNDWHPVYDAGYVRVRYEGSSALRLTGTSEALMRSQARWQALAAAVERIHVELVLPESGELAREVSFDYPQERVFLDILLTSGTTHSQDNRPGAD